MSFAFIMRYDEIHASKSYRINLILHADLSRGAGYRMEDNRSPGTSVSAAARKINSHMLIRSFDLYFL